MFDEALGRLHALGESMLALLPGLLLGLVVFSFGLVVVRGVRAAVTHAAAEIAENLDRLARGAPLIHQLR